MSILLTSCLIAMKNNVTCIKYCVTVHERNAKDLFGLLKLQVRFLINKKGKGFLASSLSMYEF